MPLDATLREQEEIPLINRWENARELLLRSMWGTRVFFAWLQGKRRKEKDQGGHVALLGNVRGLQPKASQREGVKRGSGRPMKKKKHKLPGGSLQGGADRGLFPLFSARGFLKQGPFAWWGTAGHMCLGVEGEEEGHIYMGISNVGGS